MTRFRMVLVVVGSALVFTFVGPFLYRAVGLDSPVGTCSPVGDSSPVGGNSPVGNNSPIGDCSPVGTRAPTRISNSLSGGGQSGQVITVPSGTAVTDQATLRGDNVGGPSAPGGQNADANAIVQRAALSAADATGAGGTVTYSIYTLNPHHWGWNKVASGGTVTVTDGVVPPSSPVTLDAGVYVWKAAYSGDALNAPSSSRKASGIEIVLPAGPRCPTGEGWVSVRCFHHLHHGGDGFAKGGGRAAFGGGGGGEDNFGGGTGDNHHGSDAVTRRFER